MKKLGLIFAFIFALAAPAFADPVEGMWKTGEDDGKYAHIKVSKCGTKICGVFTRTFDSKGEIPSDVIGRNFVWDMEPNGDGTYSNGKIWQPSKDRTFKSTMKLSGNSLSVVGRWGPISKTQTWSRLK